ncbi:MAG: AAA family ATPase [Firmicutes bacterium]|nr:AAA family ATPase [Bacillota bacterium]
MIQIHYITIDNFGPVKYFSEEVRPLTLFIGPQASGKSTISKLIYYFRSIKDDLFKTILEAENTENPHADFIRDLRSKFLGIFGTTKHMRRFKITYKYDTNISIVLTLKQGYVYIEFSYELKHLIGVTKINSLRSQFLSVIYNLFERFRKVLF